MKLAVLAVGNKMPSWVDEGFAEYAKRLPREAQIVLTEIKPEKRGAGKSVAQILEAERDRITAALPPRSDVVALDEHGETLTTAALSRQLDGWRRDGGAPVFVIGGADGLHADIKRGARRVLALSAMTLPHGLARVMLAEQLYRAVSILQHHPYHRV
ncbi:MAG TPA: 23S rRNA (pseudouridine(1915)-N(3))-methyltransferase RlmH [Betaproteobacteria bacterium]|nr:23S rRNA (pseudouridine(1915)-N(3))-methyltransferase RlmH [Betaproteobacteria bacterium]